MFQTSSPQGSSPNAAEEELAIHPDLSARRLLLNKAQPSGLDAVDEFATGNMELGTGLPTEMCRMQNREF